MYKQEIGENIKKYRINAGYKQKTAAEMLKLCRTTYNKYENGGCTPSLDTLYEMSRIFNTSIYNLLPTYEKNTIQANAGIIQTFDQLKEQEKSYILKLMNMMIDAHK